ncbi:MAG: L-threonylcarbamoyladenylate synthase [Terriglobales bacterium]
MATGGRSLPPIFFAGFVTNWIPLDPIAPAPEVVSSLAARLRAGAVLAIPTDTIYGLAAHACDAAAVERIFAIKGRAEDKPLPVLVSGLSQAEALAAWLPPAFTPLAAAFWPGPLTLVLPARPGLPSQLLAGGASVAVRWPAAAIAQALLAACGFPLTATSANRSGQPGCRSAAEVEAQLGARVDGIVDGGPAPAALPSTLLDLTGPVPRLLREGAVPQAALRPWLEA